MTLLLTHITPFGILFAADQAISSKSASGEFQLLEFRRKIFQIPHLNAGVGYFGQADISVGTPISTWLESFIQNNTDAPSLHEFAVRLRNGLESAQTTYYWGTGFHLCGYSPAAALGVEFYLLKNYSTLKDLWSGKFKRTYCLDEHLHQYISAPATPFWIVDFHNGAISEYNKILESKFKALNEAPAGSRLPAYLKTEKNYVAYVKNVFQEIIKSYSKKGNRAVGSKTGEPEMIFIKAP